ncbi:TRAP transporter small permease [Rhizobium halophytocola]|uniref:TRAP transporter small permease protein n=1 Tax=Rhizobium halophytocola TaxID=735519 RepID=A0ABS4DU02_9HYPH|nr:TRAP transporter small permease subunit [Rhizobium halophytocola]MBP1849166.1 TRAP-type C4-dicarboxylate transport system permease small subunit [Rhizobium halophytocola]
MTVLLGAAGLLGRINAAVLALGRYLGAVCMGIMVIVILVQVWFRYVLGDGLNWTEELARFLMLWMTGLMAPTAYRRGGFVSIGMITQFLPRLIASVLSILLLLLSAVVLWWGLRIGWAEVTGLGGRFAMPAISYPSAIDFSSWTKVPRGWMMASLAVGVTAMFAVNFELLLRALASLLGAETRLEPIPMEASLGAE